MKLKIGLALYSLMTELKEDYMGTLEQVAKMGFKYIEYVGTPLDENKVPVATPEAIGQKVKELGLVPISSHVMMDIGSDVDRLIADNVKMGSQAIVVPMVSMESLERVRELAEFCNEVAAKCKAQGMDFYYHNHFHEFVEFEGKTALQWLVELTDESLVNIELDTYWAARAGLNPIAVLKSLGNRCSLVHQKDLNVDANDVNLVNCVEHPTTMQAVFSVFQSQTKGDDIVCLGEGRLDIPGIIKTVEELDASPYIIIELDSISSLTEAQTYRGRTPLECVKVSKDYLEALL